MNTNSARLDYTRIGQLARKHWRELAILRFGHEQEKRFTRENNLTRQESRAWFLVAGVMLISGILCIDYLLQAIPPDYMAMRVGVAAKILIPALLAALFMTARFPYSSEYAIAVAVTITACGMVYERHLAMQWGIHIPPSFALLPLFVGTLLCRLRWLLILPAQIMVFSGSVYMELEVTQSADSKLANIYAMTLLLMPAIFGSWMIEFFNRLTWLRRDWLSQVTAFDHLTGLLNKHAFHSELKQRMRYAARQQRPITLVVFDVDHFKAYNDNYGHPAGDRCLVKIADAMRSCARRGGDLVARIGGEEFALVWFGIDRITAHMLLDRLLGNVRALNIEHKHTGTTTNIVTVSAGARWLVPSRDQNPEELIHAADMLMYSAKGAGRNQARLE